jgi:hypothetical protein
VGSRQQVLQDLLGHCTNGVTYIPITLDDGDPGIPAHLGAWCPYGYNSVGAGINQALSEPFHEVHELPVNVPYL